MGKGQNTASALCGVFQEVTEWLDCQDNTHGNVQAFFTGEVGMRILAPLTPCHFSHRPFSFP